jgi:hypothetical protein
MREIGRKIIPADSSATQFEVDKKRNVKNNAKQFNKARNLIKQHER